MGPFSMVFQSVAEPLFHGRRGRLVTGYAKGFKRRGKGQRGCVCVCVCWAGKRVFERLDWDSMARRFYAPVVDFMQLS